MKLENLAIQRLSTLNKFSSGIIRFPRVFSKLCSTFCINKKDCWELLFDMREEGMIDIVPFQGIKIK
jgi:hypothetical protein